MPPIAPSSTTSSLRRRPRQLPLYPLYFECHCSAPFPLWTAQTGNHPSRRASHADSSVIPRLLAVEVLLLDAHLECYIAMTPCFAFTGSYSLDSAFIVHLFILQSIAPNPRSTPVKPGTLFTAFAKINTAGQLNPGFYSSSRCPCDHRTLPP
jgi:hypothetical protein